MPSSSPLTHLPTTLPFLLHILFETPASLNFFFRPSNQLIIPDTQTHAIIKQYAMLLLSSNLVALIFALREVDDLSRNVAGALAVYHVAPFVRAVAGFGANDGRGLGGPVVHAIVHGGTLVALGGLFIGAWWGGSFA